MLPVYVLDYLPLSNSSLSISLSLSLLFLLWILPFPSSSLNSETLFHPFLAPLLYRDPINCQTSTHGFYLQHIDGSQVHFVNGSSIEVDQIVYCTGYSIDLPFLPQAIKEQILMEGSNQIKVNLVL